MRSKGPTPPMSETSILAGFSEANSRYRIIDQRAVSGELVELLFSHSSDLFS